MSTKGFRVMQRGPIGRYRFACGGGEREAWTTALYALTRANQRAIAVRPLRRCPPRELNDRHGRDLAVCGSTAFDTETMESCRSLNIKRGIYSAPSRSSRSEGNVPEAHVTPAALGPS
jgi:hypothetical protein